MRIRKWILLLPLSGFIAAPAAAFTIKPGEWEESNDGGTVKICLSPKRAQQWSDMFEAAFDVDDPWLDYVCKGKITRRSSSSYEYKAECLSEFGQKIKLGMRVKKTGNTGFLSDMFLLAESDEGKIREKTRQSGKRISETETLLETHTQQIRIQGNPFLLETITTNRYKKINDDEIVSHTTVQDSDGKHSQPSRTIIEIYRYRSPTCADPDEEKPRGG